MKMQQRTHEWYGLLIAGLALLCLLQFTYIKAHEYTENIDIEFSTAATGTRPFTKKMLAPPVIEEKIMLNEIVHGAPLTGPVRG